jgi:hypothetical protein
VASITHLLEQIEKSLRAGRVVNATGRTIRYCHRNEVFTDDQGNQFQALSNGVFLQMDVRDSKTGFKEPKAKTWGYAVPICDLDILLGEQLKTMGEKGRDVLALELAFTVGLAQIRAEHAQHRRSHYAINEAPDWTPSI